MEGFEPSCRFPGLSAFGADPCASLGTSPKAPTPGLEPGHPLKDYSRFSKPLPYLLGLYRHKRRRQDSNLHSLPACLFSGQGLHQMSDCGKALPTGFEPVHPFGWPPASNRAPCQFGQDSM